MHIVGFEVNNTDHPTIPWSSLGVLKLYGATIIDEKIIYANIRSLGNILDESTYGGKRDT